jgi:hypothetical protein
VSSEVLAGVEEEYEIGTALMRMNREVDEKKALRREEAKRVRRSSCD